jgi:hypothetical protein
VNRKIVYTVLFVYQLNPQNAIVAFPYPARLIFSVAKPVRPNVDYQDIVTVFVIDIGEIV